ncbi:MAG: HAMP domain-containing methyl-accepting chemotaxis protein [Microcoleaceae cyanobacterium]|jgi:methyl-accepting chemotaxis protein
MWKNMNLQMRLIGAFLIMGVLVFLVAFIGWSGTNRLSQYLDQISETQLPSVEGLWKVNQGQTQIESSERALLNPVLTLEERKAEVNRINKAWEQINDGLKQYEETPRTPDEEKLYKVMIKDWDKWKLAHDNFLLLNQKFEKIGLVNPFEVKLNLITQNKGNSPEMATAKEAATLYTQLTDQAKTNHIYFQVSAQSIIKVADYNRAQAIETNNIADRDSQQTNTLALGGMILGPVSAIMLGWFLSIAIAKPLDQALTGVINMIVSSSTEIASTVEEQERIASEQAASVNETTTTMDELGASSRLSSEQSDIAVENARRILNLAEEGTSGARQVLNLAQNGNNVVAKTVDGMSVLQNKVQEIAEKITRLSDQATQINSITAVVFDLANQTNMLALNAAVEAVRAGESGKGFAVVASEIRRLADQSKQSAEKIKHLIIAIQNAISSTVIVTDEGTKSVRESIKFSNDTSQAFLGVTKAINDVVLNNQEKSVKAINDIVVSNQQIAMNAKQQASAIEQVVISMNAINNGARQTATGISQTKIGIQKLNEAALSLRELSGGKSA